MRQVTKENTMMRRWLTVFVVSAVPVASFVISNSHYHGHAVRKSTAPLQMSVPTPLDTLTSGLASICRLPNGITVSDNAVESGEEPRLVLYDVENDINCRLVRERITELDLVVSIIPAAPNSRVFNDDTYEYALPAATSLPRLVAADKGEVEELVLDGTDDILSFLNKRFVKDTNESVEGSNELKDQAISAVSNVGNYVASALRLGRGKNVCSAAQGPSVPRPLKQLILYSYEGNQFCRLVREVLTELDLPYEVRSAGKSSPRREELASITGGSSQCPYLIDDNTNTKMAESADIIRYMYKNYALWTPPNELLQAASNVLIPLFKPLFAATTPLQAGSFRDDKTSYEGDLRNAVSQVESEVSQNAVVVYTYKWSPFSNECKELLSNLDIEYKEVSLGKEWLPGFLSDPAKRAALLQMTGQSSVPHVFIGGKSIGGLFSGTPGLVPCLEKGELLNLVEQATRTSSSTEVRAFE